MRHREKRQSETGFWVREITEQDKQQDSVLVAAVVQERKERQIQKADGYERRVSTAPVIINLERVRKETVRKERKEIMSACLFVFVFTIQRNLGI